MRKLFYPALLLLVTSVCFAQESAPTEQTRLALEKTDRDSPVAQGLKLEKEIDKGRLPNGYKAILKPEQVEPVQEITRDYAEAIAYLTLRIELLKKEQEAKLHSLLTSEQISNIKKPTRRTTRAKVENKPVEAQN